jgi:hypothetical protein
MSKRATRRPGNFNKPGHWDNAPAPGSKPGKGSKDDPDGLSPTRYGDWVKNGIAIDF